MSIRILLFLIPILFTGFYAEGQVGLLKYNAVCNYYVTPQGNGKGYVLRVTLQSGKYQIRNLVVDSFLINGSARQFKIKRNANSIKLEYNFYIQRQSPVAEGDTKIDELKVEEISDCKIYSHSKSKRIITQVNKIKNSNQKVQ